MTTEYRNYAPLVLDAVSFDRLRSPEYRRFLDAAVFTPGVRLLLARRKHRPDWPFVDTKFNPNTGADLPAEAYGVIYCWFLGRGSEALAGHLPRLDAIEGLSPVERAEAKSCFAQLVEAMTHAIPRVMNANFGRCPFRINRDYKAVDAAGQTFAISHTIRSAGDTFCAKGLIAEGSPANVQRGVNMILDCANYVRDNAYGSD
ncbi:MAG: hypothetical protein PHU85_11260, partial [Phycisphaerae bacterium]|nr:hypothetical protein [Phycisphaerae bacterium]